MPMGAVVMARSEPVLNEIIEPVKVTAGYAVQITVRNLIIELNSIKKPVRDELLPV